VRAFVTIGLTIAACCATERTAHAQDLAEMDEEPEARVAFRAGQAAFQRGHYTDALESFREAYRLDPRPELLYDIGESALRAERLHDALEAFETYLEQVSDVHPRRAAVSRKVTELRAAIARGDADAAEGPGAAPWIVAGVGGALVVAGGILLGAGIAESSAAEDPSRPPTGMENARRTANALIGTSIALLVLGALGLAGGLYWGLSADDGGETALEARVTPMGGSLLLHF
jgi:tetratricopeptide (TPR) repeat protein